MLYRGTSYCCSERVGAIGVHPRLTVTPKLLDHTAVARGTATTWNLYVLLFSRTRNQAAYILYVAGEFQTLTGLVGKNACRCPNCHTEKTGGLFNDTPQPERAVLPL